MPTSAIVHARAKGVGLKLLSKIHEPASHRTQWRVATFGADPIGLAAGLISDAWPNITQLDGIAGGWWNELQNRLLILVTIVGHFYRRPIAIVLLEPLIVASRNALCRLLDGEASRHHPREATVLKNLLFTTFALNSMDMARGQASHN